MSTLKLQRNVQFIYEEALARAESQALGCRGWRRSEDDPWSVGVDSVDSPSEFIRRTAYSADLDGRPSVYGQLIRPRYQGGEFNRTRSVNQYLTHWIYPYRGKFHPQLVRALLNLVGVRRGDLVLDPFVGSGTTALEASLLGVRALGVDVSPLCVLLTRVKTGSVSALAAVRHAVASAAAGGRVDPADPALSRHPDPAAAAFLEAARLVALSDSARRGRDGGVSFRRNVKHMLASVESHARALSVFGIDPGPAAAVPGDARDLDAAGIRPGSVDAVVTSPPYSSALDYAANDDHALKAMGVDTGRLRSSMIGVRGSRPPQRLSYYREDMQVVFSEIARVLKLGAKAVFVVGDATVSGREQALTADAAVWAAEAGLRKVWELRKAVYGLYSIMKDEKILIFQKPV